MHKHKISFIADLSSILPRRVGRPWSSRLAKALCPLLPARAQRHERARISLSAHLACANSSEICGQIRNRAQERANTDKIYQICTQFSPEPPQSCDLSYSVSLPPSSPFLFFTLPHPHISAFSSPSLFIFISRLSSPMSLYLSATLSPLPSPSLSSLPFSLPLSPPLPMPPSIPPSPS